MTEREVYELQERLRDAESDLAGLAAAEHDAQRSGAPVASGDYLRSPQGRAVEALRTQVAAAQAEVGGTVYRLPVENLPFVREDLDKLVKRANKLGMGAVTYRVSDEVERVEHKVDPLVAQAELGYVPRYPKGYRFLVLNAEVVKLAGWALLATLTVESGGVMISRVPGTDEKVRLTDYRDATRATLCNHCGLSRRRTKTYLVEHENGEIKQVGSNCLRDFLGVDPHGLVKYATYLREIQDTMGEDGERGYGGGPSLSSSEEYLTHVCTMLRTEGWAPRSGYGLSTADAAWSNLRSYGKMEKGKPMFTEVTEEDHARAVAAIEWAVEYLGAKVNQSQDASDFEHNMYVAANGDTVPKKGDGVLAYLPVAHAKHQEREIERKQREKRNAEAGATSVHVGQVKDRITVTGLVAAVFESQGDYGTTYITKIEGDDGNIYKWFGSYDLGRGNKITASFAVKKHDEYQGVKETVVTRPTKVEVLATEDGEPVPLTVNDEVVVDGRRGKVTQVNLKFKTVVVEYSDDEAPALVRWEDARKPEAVEDEGLQVPASYQ